MRREMQQMDTANARLVKELAQRDGALAILQTRVAELEHEQHTLTDELATRESAAADLEKELPELVGATIQPNIILIILLIFFWDKY